MSVSVSENAADWSCGLDESEVAGFVTKTFEILGVEEYHKIIYWSSSGLEFVIKDVVKFEEIVLPRYFRHKKMNSFVRQLNMYGFHKIKHNNFKSTFRHQNFQKDRSDLLPLIRRKPKNSLEDSSDQTKPQPSLQAIVKGEEPTMSHEKWANLSSEFLETTRMINMSLVKVTCNDLSDIVNHNIPEEDDCASIEEEIEGNYQFEDPALFFSSKIDL